MASCAEWLFVLTDLKGYKTALVVARYEETLQMNS